MLLNEQSRRLGIFAFFDADGIVDDYVLYLLGAVAKFCTRQIVVVNGELTNESRQKLSGVCDEVRIRPNQGYDITGYKEVFLSLEDVGSYDEILFYNQTVFGPVCPLDTMFATMNARDVDFWGMTRHIGAKRATWDTQQKIPPHLQSYFFAVRQPMLTAPEFHDYWQQLPEIETYWDAVGKHEVVFTSHFSERGYRWDTYLHTQELDGCNDYQLMGMPAELMRRGCPFVKRKCFFEDRLSYSSVPQGEAAHRAVEYIVRHTEYPLRLITKNLLRTEGIAALTAAMEPCVTVQENDAPVPEKTAVLLWFSTPALGGLLCRAAARMAGCRLYCLFATQALQQQFAEHLPQGARCAVGSKNGAQYLFGMLWKEIAAFDYLLYLNNGLPLLLEEFCDATSLGNAVESLASPRLAGVLARHPELGVLAAIPGIQQEILSCGLNWPQLALQLEPSLRGAGITVPLGEKESGLVLRGGMFFARTAALAPLADFPFEASHFEGLYSAWEYLVPLAAQSTGFLTGWSTDEELLRAAWANNAAMLNEILQIWATPKKRRSDQVLFRMRGIMDFYMERRHQMTLEQAFHAQLSFKQKLWITLQLFLKPQTFARLHHGKPEAPPPPDSMD